MSKASLLLKLYVFLIGVGANIEVGIIGRFSLAEILLYLALPILFFRNDRPICNDTAKKVFGLLALFGLAVIVSDLVNQNHMVFFLRGFARPVAIALSTLSLLLIFSRSLQLVIWFFVGLLPGACIAYFQVSEFVNEGDGGYMFFSAKIQPIIFAATIIVSIILYRFNRLLAAIFLIFPVVVIALYGSRSSTLTYLLTLFTLVYLWILKGGGRRRIQMSAKFFLGSAAVMLLGLCFVYFAYIYVAPRGYLGEMQQAKFYDQSSTRFGVTPLGLVAAGRTAVVAGVLAGLDNPLLGLGSWPNIGEYSLEAMDIAGESISDLMYMSSFQNAAGHSIIIGTWYNNGLFAVLYWLFLVVLMLRVFLLMLRRDNILTPALILIFYDMAWALMFSPLNLKGRIWAALFAALAICLTDKRGPLVSERDFAMLSPFSKVFKRRSMFR